SWQALIRSWARRWRAKPADDTPARTRVTQTHEENRHGPDVGDLPYTEGQRGIRPALLRHPRASRLEDSRPQEIRGKRWPHRDPGGRRRHPSDRHAAFRRPRGDRKGVRKPRGTGGRGGPPAFRAG